MSETPSDFRETLVELVETTYPEPAEHPSPERWIAYQRGELPAAEEARLEEHLVRCRDCFDLVQAADAICGPAEEPAADPENEAAAAAELWRRLRPQLGGEVPAVVGRGPRPIPRLHLPYPLAAALLFGFLGLTAWNLEQQKTLTALRAPRPDAPIYDFSAGERLAPAGATPLQLGSGPCMLVFHPGDELPLYRLAIRDAATGRERSSHLLRLNANLALTLQLSAGLPPGDYRLELSGGAGGSGGTGGGAGKILEQHLLHVTAGPGG